MTKTQIRGYQQDTLTALKNARKQNKKTALISLATGLGKTYIAVQDVKQVKATRVLFTAHMNDILDEAKDEFQRQAPNVDVQFSTLQHLYENLSNYTKNEFDYIVYDEAHHMKAQTYQKVANHFTPSFSLALTATPIRADGKKISDIFDKPVYEMSLPKALAHNWLAQLDYQIVFDDAVKEAIDKGFTPSSIIELRKLLQVKPRNEQIIKALEREKHRMKLDHAQTIVFCQSIEHADEMAQLLKGRAYHSDLPKSEKDRIFSEFKTGKLEVICTVDMFNEGVNIPDARLIVFLRSTASRTVFLQQLGRGLRKTKTKRRVSVLDFVGNVKRLEFISTLASEVQLQEQRRTRKEHTSIQTIRTNFEFASEIVEILEHLEDFYQEVPEGKLLLSDLRKKHGFKRKPFITMLEAKKVKIEKGYKGFKPYSYIDAQEWQKFIARNHTFFQKEDQENLTSISNLSKQYDVDITTVRAHIKKLGLIPSQKLFNKHGGSTLTPKEVDIIKSAYPAIYQPKAHPDSISTKQLMKELSMSEQLLQKMLEKHNIQLEVKRLHSGRVGREITQEMRERIKSIYKDEYCVYPLASKNVLSFKAFLRKEHINHKTLDRYVEKLGIKPKLYVHKGRKTVPFKGLTKRQQEKILDALNSTNKRTNLGKTMSKDEK